MYLCPQILLMAMKDMNIAKLTSTDLPLFNGITQDLFPAVETPVIDYGKVRRSRISDSSLSSIETRLIRVSQHLDPLHPGLDKGPVSEYCLGGSGDCIVLRVSLVWLGALSLLAARFSVICSDRLQWLLIPTFKLRHLCSPCVEAQGVALCVWFTVILPYVLLCGHPSYISLTVHCLWFSLLQLPPITFVEPQHFFDLSVFINSFLLL